MSLVPEEWEDQIEEAREIPAQGVCCMQAFIFTHGLLTQVRFDGPTYDFAARYCYPSRADCLRALNTWDGRGDPPEGWVKEKLSGRRPGSEP